MRGEKRRDSREPEKAKLIVKGTDLDGISFEEETETIDVSTAGLSFFLNTPLFTNTFLSVEISNSSLLAHMSKAQALVVRIDTSSPKKQFVAAQFL
jgi:hypothetical protein